MDIGLITPPEVKPASLVAEMDRNGYAVIHDYLSPGQLDEMRSFVAAAVGRANGAYVGFTTPESVAESGLDRLGASPEFNSLLRQIYEIATRKTAPEEPLYQVLRCLTGKSFGQHSLLFHYDSYLLTVLIPVEIPVTGQTGDLVMLPNTRPIRSSYYRNVLDKILLDNRVTQFLMKALHRRGWLPVTRLKLQPGNAYFFWGYRSIHTNEACDPNSVRATALFHYANPHLGRSRRARHT